MLPEVKQVTPLPVFTPTKWQTVILRNYGLVDATTLATVLNTDVSTVEREAKRMGVEKIPYYPDWQKSGYITIIRNNWHLLPYKQLIALLHTDEATLDYNLREDDFLNVKLGLFKSDCENVTYSPLTDEQIEETEKIASLVKREFIDNYARPFDFYSDCEIKKQPVRNERSDFDKIVYSYSMLYGDTFMDGDEIIPDGLLAKMQSVGVNGLWMQGVLAKLSPYPFVRGMDDGYEIRRKNLNAIISKCKKYGIGVYLYLNEPRGIPNDCLTDTTSSIKGRFYEERWSLCTTTQPVKDYLYCAVKDLVTAVPDLKGIITITMSENMTNCHSRPNNDCPFCKHLKHQDVVPEVNNIIQRAVTDAGVKTRVIANLWGWTSNYEWLPKDTLEGIKRMDENIDVLSVSELGTVFINGKKQNVTEYSLSKVGPCEETKANLAFAKRNGHKIMAKVQINNSWEMAIVPFVPVFELVLEHMRNLKGLGVDGLMMSWTLGGYPSIALDLSSRVFEDDFDYDEWLVAQFESNASTVKQAVNLFSQAYRNYPYDIRTLYMSNQECGPSNLLYPQNTNYSATMVGFPFDDVKSWVGYYEQEQYLSLLGKLLDGWKRGLDLLQDITGNQNLTQLKRYAETVYVNLKSTEVQIQFVNARDKGDVIAIKNLIEQEYALTKRLYQLASDDCRIGYEASNHYYFTQNSFIEKLINLEYVKRALNV